MMVMTGRNRTWFVDEGGEGGSQGVAAVEAAVLAVVELGLGGGRHAGRRHGAAGLAPERLLRNLNVHAKGQSGCCGASLFKKVLDQMLL